ncbi:hypothetical protein QUB75_19250 [Microcoleus sp. K1-B6]|uniref:hypothetical protein n=1 Tax=unclassified Microcoleus TaxID=2642155 RepID=UPI002FD1E54E
MLKEKWRCGNRCRSPMLVFSPSTMLSLPHACVGLACGKQNIEQIDEESFFATAAGQTVDAWSGVKFNDSPDQASPRYETPGRVFQLPTAEFCH